jgi:ABC-type sulfate/molybdate transport systems ATPase subunit
MLPDVEARVPAMRPARSNLCIVMVCSDCDEAEEIGREFLKVKTGCLRTYRSTYDVLENPPREPVAAVILATSDDPETTGQTLQWMRHRWPRCPLTVVGDLGGEEHEMAARENSANFLTRPVASSQWRAIANHATGQEQDLEGGSSPVRAKSGRSPVSLEPVAVRARLEPPANVRVV